jgi:protein-S-isoprenylcysteine O-methyltransferase Ste14
MSLIPAFKIGVWNAWIFMLAFAIGHALPPFLWTRISKDFKKRAWPTDVYLNKTEKIVGTLPMPIIGLLLIYSIFLPLPLGAVWFYIGLAIFLLGLIVYVIPSKDVFDTPSDEPFTKGIYRYSRHPIYLTMVLELIGVGIASASWLFLLLVIMLFISLNISVVAEERGCLEKYGDSYREYVNRTSRWIGIPKSG